MIEQMKADFAVAYSAKQLGVSESGYYKWRARTISPRQAVRWDLAAKVLAAFVASGRAAGYRKIHHQLAEAGIVVNPKTVLESMRQMRLVPLATIRAWKRTAARNRATPDPVDLVARNFSTAIEPGSVLVGDITYVPTGEGWLYVATTIDLATRTVLGVAMSATQDKRLVVRALRAAIKSGHVKDNAIFHTDHGRQYASNTMRRFCKKHHIRQSMGANYECWDNAVAESFFSKLKGERLDWIPLPTRRTAIHETTAWIDYYNTRRPHQTLGYATPTATLNRLTRPANTHPAAA